MTTDHPCGTTISPRAARHVLRGALVVACVIAGLTGARAQVEPSCERAGEAAEAGFGLPPGLLVAIGRVESGRWDDARRQIVAWPWSADIDGQPHRYASAEAAVRDVRAQRDAGGHSIDVGCFQINLGWHPGAFASLEQAFDPVSNATYAASFLRSLNARLGSWPAAVAAYHSANPEQGIPYRDRVMAAWSAAPAEPRAWLPVTERFGVRVWTPTQGAAAESAPESDALAVIRTVPRVITPTR
jgi:hypothetical protein